MRVAIAVVLRLGVLPGVQGSRMFAALMLAALGACSSRRAAPVEPSEPASRESSEESAESQETEEPPEPAPVFTDPIRIDVAAEREIDEAVARAMREDALPGAVVIAGEGAGVRFRRAYGWSSTHTDERGPLSTDAVFDLASLTKVCTTLALLRLVEAGRLELEQDMGAYWPALSGRTLEDVLYHRAGLSSVDRLADYGADRAGNIERIAAHDVQPPGSYRYSDLGFILLGEVVARVTGQPLEQAMLELVAQPLSLEARFLPRDGEPDAAFVRRVLPTEFAPRRGPIDGPTPMIRGEVHDPRAYRLGGVAGHAGLFGTADDIAKISELLLSSGGAFLGEASIARMRRIQEIGSTQRALGLEVFEGGLAHRGFTGTYFHVDVATQRYIVVMSHAVHPSGAGDANPLRQELRALLPRIRFLSPPSAGVGLGIDVLRADGFAALRGKRVALYTHDAAVALDGQTTRRIFERAPEVNLRVVFAPEHGLGADQEGEIGDARVGDVEIYGLFGRRRDPPPEAFRNVDVLVMDVQDVGVRFYTYFATLHRLLRAAAEHQTPVLILDRPNPLGRDVAGPLVDPARSSFINHHSLPILHGLTAGEMARLLMAEDELALDVSVVEVAGWQGETWDALGLRWVPPSPNLRSLKAVALYPGVAMVEGANVSVGRGTDSPFERVGAPWADAPAWQRQLADVGVRSEVIRFVPEARPYRGRTCAGLRIESAPDSIALGLALLAAAAAQPEFQAERAAGIVADDAILERALAGEAGLRQSFRAAEQAFERRRRPHLLYPAPPL